MRASWQIRDQPLRCRLIECSHVAQRDSTSQAMPNQVDVGVWLILEGRANLHSQRLYIRNDGISERVSATICYWSTSRRTPTIAIHQKICAWETTLQTCINTISLPK